MVNGTIDRELTVDASGVGQLKTGRRTTVEDGQENKARRRDVADGGAAGGRVRQKAPHRCKRTRTTD